MFSKDWVYCNISNDSKLKIYHSNIVRINLIGEKITLSCMGYGALVGLGISLIGIFAFSSQEDREFALALGVPFVTVLGGLGGLIFGLASPSGDEEFILDYKTDLIQLKPFVKYYFQYDESLEEQYVEIK